MEFPAQPAQDHSQMLPQRPRKACAGKKLGGIAVILGCGFVHHLLKMNREFIRIERSSLPDFRGIAVLYQGTIKRLSFQILFNHREHRVFTEGLGKFAVFSPWSPVVNSSVDQFFHFISKIAETGRCVRGDNHVWTYFLRPF